MHDRPPELTYGTQPRAGSVVYRPQPDGSLTIGLIPRSFAQMLPLAVWCGIFIVLPVLALVWHYHQGGPGWSILVGAFVCVMLLPLVLWVLFSTGRHRLYIAASPAGLSIWTTELGDPVRFDWPREQIVDVRVDLTTGDETPVGFHVYLKGRCEPVLIPVYRAPQVLEGNRMWFSCLSSDAAMLVGSAYLDRRMVFSTC